MAAIIAGTKLGFRAGLQQSLDNLIGVNNNSGTPGIFYLTTDTHRLYVCDDDGGQIHPVNEGITFVSSTSDLPNLTTMTEAQRKNMQGQFYYVGGSSNILCVASGSNWVQINPDTYYQLDNTNGVRQTVTDNSTGENKVATITTYVREDRVTGGNPDVDDYIEKSSTFTIEATPNANMVIDSSNRKITFSPADGATYDLVGESKSGGGVTLKLRGSNGTEDQINIVSAAGTAVQPTIAAGTSTASGTVYDITLSGSELGTGATFVTSQNPSTGGISSTITTTTSGTLTSTSIKPEINYGNSNGSTSAVASGTLSNGTLSFDLDVYTKDETDEAIEKKLNQFEGMYFAGTVGNSSATYANIAAITAEIPKAANNSGLRSGATFKVAEDITGHTTPALDGLDSGETIKQGDLIIVTGDEDANGYLISNANLKYYYVPSGDDDDMWYQPNLATANQINITSADSTTYRYTFAQGNDGVTVSGTSGTATAQTLTISHKANSNVISGAITPVSGTITQAFSGNNAKFTAVDGVSVDDYGHVTGLTTKEITFVHNGINDTAGYYSTASTLSPASGTAVQVTDYIKDKMDVTKSTNVQFSSESLRVSTVASGSTSAAPNIGIDIVWGSF